MINIEAKNTNDAWKKTLLYLYSNGVETDNEKYFRDEFTIIKINSPKLDKKDDLFPMSQNDLEIINDFIISGLNEDKVIHEWTKLYYHRMFDKPFSQIEYFINKFQMELPQGDALISMWDKKVDQGNKINPCTEIIWGRIKNGKLEFHVHAHSSDAYKKLLMNIQEFVAVQLYVANKLEIEAGDYYHILDSCHIHYKDLDNVKKIINLIK